MTEIRHHSRVEMSIHVLLATLTFVVFLWWRLGDPGVYYGHLHGQFFLDSTADPSAMCFVKVKVEAETQPKWQWTCVSNFSYHNIKIDRATFDGDSRETTMAIVFPGPYYETDQKKGKLTVETLGEFLFGNSEEAKRNPQVRELFKLIENAGHGSAPRPRHHPYHIEKLDSASFTHFSLGYSCGQFIVAGVIGAWISILVGLRLRRRKLTSK